jgi:toxin-antitoxin system PIN domain toxin
VALAIDTNVLLYAHRREAPGHVAATRRLASLVASGQPIGLPWPCVYEFLRVSTHPRVYDPPATVEQALGFLRALLRAPSVALLSETDRHGEILETVLASSGVSGNLIHDAHIVALALEHGYDEILTEDRDFERFPEIRVVRLVT